MTYEEIKEAFKVEILAGQIRERAELRAKAVVWIYENAVKKERVLTVEEFDSLLEKQGLRRIPEHPNWNLDET